MQMATDQILATRKNTIQRTWAEMLGASFRLIVSQTWFFNWEINSITMIFIFCIYIYIYSMFYKCLNRSLENLREPCQGSSSRCLIFVTLGGEIRHQLRLVVEITGFKLHPLVVQSHVVSGGGFKDVFFIPILGEVDLYNTRTLGAKWFLETGGSIHHPNWPLGRCNFFVRFADFVVFFLNVHPQPPPLFHFFGFVDSKGIEIHHHLFFSGKRRCSSASRLSFSTSDVDLETSADPHQWQAVSRLSIKAEVPWELGESPPSWEDVFK